MKRLVNVLNNLTCIKKFTELQLKWLNIATRMNEQLTFNHINEQVQINPNNNEQGEIDMNPIL